MSAETFTRLILTDPADGSEEKVELVGGVLVLARVAEVHDAKLEPPLSAGAPRSRP